MSVTAPRPASPEFLTLHGTESSLVIEHHAGQAPLWRYWGPRLRAGSAPPAALRDTLPLPSFTLDRDVDLTLIPGFGVGWFGQSALLAHRGGRDFSLSFQRCTYDWTESGQALRFTLHDDTARIEARLHLVLDRSTDVLRVRSELTNSGDGPLDIQWLAAATLPLPPHCSAVHSYAGQHLHEFMPQTDALSRSTWRRENRRGRTSHDCFPGAMVVTPGVTRDAGTVYGAHLAWSGNHQQTIEWLQDGRYQWQLGEWLAPGEICLRPGESFATPEVVACISTKGFNGLAGHFQAELRRRLRWPGGRMTPRPVHLNTWEALYFDHRLPELMQLADAAAAVGVERFVLDDGWFQGRNHDRAALGDWWADPKKYPEGLEPLVRHVQGCGMQFGLWFEPEMVNPDSELHRAHPDWALQVAGRPLLTARNQLVLDLSRPEVADDLFAKLHALLSALPIAYIKWDHNRDLTTAGGADGRAAWHVQVRAAYALMARLRAAHPNLELESCSGGGGRIDFGVLEHTHRVWTSDNIDALSRVDIQRGLLQFFPPEIMGAHIGTAPAHSTGRTQSLAFRGAVALPGHLGVELDVRSLDVDSRTQLKGWIALYKRWRQHLHTGRVWLGDAGDGLVWQVHGQPGGDDWLLLAYRTALSSQRYMRPVQLAMLDEHRRYRARVLMPEGLPAAQLFDGRAPFFDALIGPEGLLLDGSWLCHAGLPMPRAKAETAFIVHLQGQ